MAMPSIEMRKISELTPAPYNPRVISEAAMRGLRASIERFGLVQPIVVNRTTGNIVGGHQRLKVLAEQGVTEVPCVIVELPASEEKALNLTLNNPAIAGDFTEGVLPMLDDIQIQLPEMFEVLRLGDISDLLPQVDVGGTDSGLSGDSQLDDYQAWSVNVKCNSESAQAELYERLSQEGYECQLLTF